MGLFSFLGGILGASAEKKASRGAQAAEVDALNKAMGIQQANLQQTRGDLAPEFGLGNSAIGAYGDLTGANGNDKWSAALAALKDSPLYQSLFRNGQETLLQNASATGGMRGGNTERGLADFGSDTLSTTLQQRLQELMASIGIGTQAKGVAAGVGMNTANQSSGFQGKIGDANAQGILTRGGLTAGMFNSAGGFLDNAVQAFLPGGGGFKSIF
jgi:hypothetical protein